MLVLFRREPTILLIQFLVQGLVLFLNRVPSFILWSTLVNRNLKDIVVLKRLTMISCIINSVFPCAQKPCQHSLFPLPMVSIMQLFFREQVIMFRTSQISSWRTLATRTSLSCPTRTPLSLTPQFSHSRPTLRAKGTWGMVLFIVRGLLGRPSLSGSPTVTFCSVHIHNVVAKKRDASTGLLQRLCGYMREHNVDFIGGNFHMSAFSTVGDVFTDDEFSDES